MSRNHNVRTNQRVSIRQLDLLYDFLSVNRDIANCYNRSLQAKVYSKKKWSEIAAVLNAQGDGTHKSETNWCKYWVDYKARIKKRAAAVRASHGRTGGGPSTEKPLNEIEKKFLHLLGDDFGLGIPGVRVEPPLEIGAATIEFSNSDIEDSPASQSILQNVTVQPYSNIESLPQNSHLDQEMVQDSSHHSPNRTLTLSISPPLATSANHSPRRRRRPRRRREPPMSQEAARRALVRTAQLHADAAVRTSEAMESTVAILLRIERIFNAAFPAQVAREHNE